MIDVTKATTKELVAFYNEHSDKPVSKFADRKTAERRVNDLIESAPAPSSHDKEVERFHVHLAQQVAAREKNSGPDVELFDDPPAPSLDIVVKAANHDEQPIVARAKSHTRSVAIALSWNDAEITRKRSQRSAVKVNGQYYGSVAKAFKAFNLPLKEHIKFRMTLKAAGSLTAYDRRWEVVPLNYDED